jgi:hypothetical protein
MPLEVFFAEIQNIREIQVVQKEPSSVIERDAGGKFRLVLSLLSEGKAGTIPNVSPARH